MKKLLLLSILSLSVLLCNAQTNFQWNVTDSVPKTKTEIYSDTKNFIAKTWRSAQNVIQNDDKDAGNIIIVGNSIQKVSYSLNIYNFIYRYTVEFKMKDNKYKIVINNVYCDSADPEGLGRKFEIFKIQPFDSLYVKGKSFLGENLPEKKAIALMVSLKAHLQGIVDEYKVFINTKSSTDNNW